MDRKGEIVKFVQTLLSKANQRGSESKYVYYKILKNLKNCNHPIYSIDEVRFIKHIGEKTLKLITDNIFPKIETKLPIDPKKKEDPPKPISSVGLNFLQPTINSVQDLGTTDSLERCCKKKARKTASSNEESFIVSLGENHSKPKIKLTHKVKRNQYFNELGRNNDINNAKNPANIREKSSYESFLQNGIYFNQNLSDEKVVFNARMNHNCGQTSLIRKTSPESKSTPFLAADLSQDRSKSEKCGFDKSDMVLNQINFVKDFKGSEPSNEYKYDNNFDEILISSTISDPSNKNSCTSYVMNNAEIYPEIEPKNNKVNNGFEKHKNSNKSCFKHPINKIENSNLLLENDSCTLKKSKYNLNMLPLMLNSNQDFILHQNLSGNLESRSFPSQWTRFTKAPASTNCKTINRTTSLPSISIFQSLQKNLSGLAKNRNYSIPKIKNHKHNASKNIHALQLNLITPSCGPKNNVKFRTNSMSKYITDLYEAKSIPEQINNKDKIESQPLFHKKSRKFVDFDTYSNGKGGRFPLKTEKLCEKIDSMRKYTKNQENIKLSGEKCKSGQKMLHSNSDSKIKDDIRLDLETSAESEINLHSCASKSAYNFKNSICGAELTMKGTCRSKTTESGVLFSKCSDKPFSKNVSVNPNATLISSSSIVELSFLSVENSQNTTLSEKNIDDLVSTHSSSQDIQIISYKYKKRESGDNEGEEEPNLRVNRSSQSHQISNSSSAFKDTKIQFRYNISSKEADSLSVSVTKRDFNVEKLPSLIESEGSVNDLGIKRCFHEGSDFSDYQYDLNCRNNYFNENGDMNSYDYEGNNKKNQVVQMKKNVIFQPESLPATSKKNIISHEDTHISENLDERICLEKLYNTVEAVRISTNSQKKCRFEDMDDWNMNEINSKNLRKENHSSIRNNKQDLEISIENAHARMEHLQNIGPIEVGLNIDSRSLDKNNRDLSSAQDLEGSGNNVSEKSENSISKISSESKTDKKRRKKSKKTVAETSNLKYIPAYRTGAYAILRVLSNEDGISKHCIAHRGAIYCNSSLNPHERFSAWTSINQLLKKGLVMKENRYYFLTDLGKETCGVLFANASAHAEQDGQVKLIIDSREIKSKRERSFFQRKFEGLMPNETQNLNVGDFIWTYNESVLNYIIERKKGSDFVSSIIDGRFDDQKRRLINTDIENIYYIIEGLTEQCMAKTNRNHILACLSALKNSEITVIETENIEKTADLILQIDKVVRESTKHSIFCDESTIKQIKFDSFIEKGTKLDIKTSFEFFLLCLNSLKGLSRKKALALAQKYGTLSKFLESINGTESELEKIATISGDFGKIGKVVAKKILDYFHNYASNSLGEKKI